ncbi:hypothetical protein ABZ864_25390 [Streptomyces sp. NPDC047082]|uniref:hypothetical protein n=1 Tax=Streptomyces sp. NPDC047082 TaxID=3155259 RepID=UPI0033E6322A
MARGDEHNLTSIRVSPAPRTGAELRVHPAFERYVQAVRSEIDRQLTADEVDARLARTLAAHAHNIPPEREPETDALDFESRPDWAAYGFQAVQLWLRAIATIDRSRAWLHRDDIDDLAVETVARAINTFREQTSRPQEMPQPRAAEAELKTTFLTECLRHLPYAYRARRLADVSAPDDEFEWVNEPQLARMVQESATVRHGARLRRVRGMGEADMDEIVRLTLLAVRAAARRYPDALGQLDEGIGPEFLP